VAGILVARRVFGHAEIDLNQRGAGRSGKRIACPGARGQTGSSIYHGSDSTPLLPPSHLVHAPFSTTDYNRARVRMGVAEAPRSGKPPGNPRVLLVETFSELASRFPRREEARTGKVFSAGA
jgi:hypothetical protein